MVAQVLKVVVIINLIIIDHSRMIQAFRFIEISKYDDGDQLTTRGQQGSSSGGGPVHARVPIHTVNWYPGVNWSTTTMCHKMIDHMDQVKRRTQSKRR